MRPARVQPQEAVGTVIEESEVEAEEAEVRVQPQETVVTVIEESEEEMKEEAVGAVRIPKDSDEALDAKEESEEKIDAENEATRAIRNPNVYPKWSKRRMFDEWLWVENDGVANTSVMSATDYRLQVGDYIQIGGQTAVQNMANTLTGKVTKMLITDFSRGRIHYGVKRTFVMSEDVLNSPLEPLFRVRKGVMKRLDIIDGQRIWVKRDPGKSRKLIEPMATQVQSSIKQRQEDAMAAAQKATVAWEASNDGTSATPMEKAYLKLAVDGGMDGGTWKRCMQDETHSPPGLPDQGEDESWRLLDQLPKPHRPTSDDTQDVDETQSKKTRTCPFPGCGKAVKFQYNGTTTEGWERCVASDNIRKHCIGSDHIRFFFAFGRMETRKPSLYYVVQKLLYDSHKGHAISYEAFADHLQGSSNRFKTELELIKTRALGMAEDKTLANTLQYLRVKETRKDLCSDVMSIIQQIFNRLLTFPYGQFVDPAPVQSTSQSNFQVVAESRDVDCGDVEEKHNVDDGDGVKSVIPDSGSSFPHFELYNLLNLFLMRGLFFVRRDCVDSDEQSPGDSSAVFIDRGSLTPVDFMLQRKPPIPKNPKNPKNRKNAPKRRAQDLSASASARKRKPKQHDSPQKRKAEDPQSAVADKLADLGPEKNTGTM